MDDTIHKNEVAAVVVLYNPPADVLGNIESYIGQVGVVIAVDNTTDLDPGFRAELESRGVEYLPMGGNKGIAAALNAGSRRALASGHAWALTMDQDSTAPEGFVEGLARCLSEPDSDRIAIIAPKWEQAGGLTEEKVAECRDLVSAMTSGNLLRLSAFDDLGGFREDLFIDRVDNEFCMRALRQGRRVTQRQDVVLLHRCGTLQLVTFPIRCYITDYSPVRRYYMVRNFFELRAEYGKEFPTWLDEERRYWRRELVKILLAEPKRLAKFRMMLRGWVDYRHGRFGAYDELHSS